MLRFYCKRAIAVVALSSIYSFAIIISTIFRHLLRRRRTTGRILINGTFHNPNWFFAHIEPIVNSGSGQVILVTDSPIANLDNLTYACPPAWLNKLLTRAGAKFIMTLWQAIKAPADILIGYHIFPSAITALICARLTGAKAVFQVTSGQLELEGGGWDAENALLRALGKPSSLVEKLAHTVTNQFDMVVVRGQNAKRYVQHHGFSGQTEIITGSVVFPENVNLDNRHYDVITIGRLSEYKRPDLFISTIRELARTKPDIKAAMVGDGPLKAELETLITDYNLDNNIEMLGQRSDILDLLLQSKTFVLTSRWEGVSIAMLEAMACGVVPVVSNVGDLSDFARNDDTGFTIDESSHEQFAAKLSELLHSDEHRQNIAQAARSLILSRSEKQAVINTWHDKLLSLKSS